MHESISRAFDEIDAAIFSGDVFHTGESLTTLKKYLARWGRALPDLTEIVAENSDD